MIKNIKPLKDAVKLISDLVINSVKAAEEKGDSTKIVMDFAPVIQDLMVLIPEFGQISDLSELSAEDYDALIEELAVDLVLPGKSGAIISATIHLLVDITKIIVPDVLAIVQAAKA